MFRAVITLILLLFAAPAPAEVEVPRPPADLAETGRDIPLAEWKWKVEGRTVWYFTSGHLWGREYYHPGAGYVTFQYWTGECRQASWTFAEGIYCFDFREENPHCFRHLEQDGQVWALPVSGGEAQAVMFIDDSRPDCGPAPSS